MRSLVLLLLSLLAVTALAAGCSSDSGAESNPAPTPSSAPSSPQRSVNSLTVSDAVPTLDELRDLGLSDAGAQCFIDTIDPEGTGRVQSADAFVEAWATCL